jgi:S1-C subfamily serine protease
MSAARIQTGFALALLLALSACVQNSATSGGPSTQPATPQAATNIKIGNKNYTSWRKAYEDLQSEEDKALAQVNPASQKLGGKVLAVMPTRSAVAKVIEKELAKLSLAEEKEAAINTVMLGTQTNVRAFEKAKIFDGLTAIYADDVEAVPYADANYKIFAERPVGTSILKWTLYKKDGGNQSIVLPSLPPGNRAQFLKSLNSALLNAAADLGAPVRREEAPGMQKQGNSSGTAFFIDASGHALTNAHVVRGCKSLKMALKEGEATEVKVSSLDGWNDLALLTVQPAPKNFAQFSPNTLRQGDDVVSYGFPLSGLLSVQGNLSTGIISALAGIRDDARHLQITAPIQPGNSGGPLLDREGHVVGVTFSMLNAVNLAASTGAMAQNVNFAIKPDVVLTFLEKNGAPGKKGASTKKTLSASDVGDIAKSFTYKLICEK